MVIVCTCNYEPTADMNILVWAAKNIDWTIMPTLFLDMKQQVMARHIS